MLGYNSGVVRITNNTFTECGSHSASGYPVFVESGQQIYTMFAANVLNKPDGIFNFRPNTYNDTYLSFFDNKLFEVIDAYANGGNNIISDARGAAPNATNTHMGSVGDVCKPAAPSVGQPVGWICTAAWDPDTQTSTWVALANL